MVCTRIGNAIVCGPRQRVQRCACGQPGTQLCDWKTPAGPKPTCDRPICTRCSYVPAPDKDLCPDHAAEWRARSRAA